MYVTVLSIGLKILKEIWNRDFRTFFSVLSSLIFQVKGVRTAKSKMVLARGLEKKRIGSYCLMDTTVPSVGKDVEMSAAVSATV